MRSYAATHPRLFAAVRGLDQALAPLQKPVLWALFLAELLHCALEALPLASGRLAVFAVAFAVYSVLFHLCADENARALAARYLRKFCGRR